ncbi:hypothetical protein evm_004929 [Chilo suppressalis]|nr:hypothetical protein evm_004929 [Chilo suppressalis]
MCNAFNSEHIRIMACLFNKSIYLCSLETPLEKKKRLSRNHQDGRFCAWGYKFEQYMLADVPGVNPIIERPVVENEEFTLYYKTNLGDHTLLYGAQIDGLIATDGIVLPPPNTTDFQTNLNYLKQHTYVELKTNRIIQIKRQEQTFKKYKLLRCWCQCYLANLRGLLVGYRDDHGIVTSLNYYNTEDIPKYCKHEWQPERCLKFLQHFLSFVRFTFNRIHLDPNETMSLIFDLHGRDPITVSECNNEYSSILPEWYIQAMNNKNTLAPSHLHETNNRAGAACEAAEKAKAGKYRGLGSEYDFVPFGVETLGAWGPSAIRLFKEIAKRLVDITGDRRAGSYLGQRISLAIQRENAASIFGTLPKGTPFNNVF